MNKQIKDTLKKIDRLVERYIEISLDRIEIFPDVLVLKYHIPTSDFIRNAQRVHPKSLEKIALHFKQRGFDVEEISKWGIHIVFNAERIAYTLKQAERLNKILSTKRNKD